MFESTHGRIGTDWYTREVTAERSLKSYRERIDSRLADLIPDENEPPVRLHQAMRYSALAPGKRLRPTLCLSSALAVGGDLDQALDPACAVELVHCFSLIHDDLPALDNDDLRRGLPTCHKVFGDSTAILAGDALFSLAFHVLASSRLSSEVSSACVERLSDAAAKLVRGEVADLEAEGRASERQELEFIHRHKTAALFAAACAIGGLAGNGDEAQIEALALYGMHLGLGFQIADDILNEVASESQLGKAAGSDRARKKSTFVSCLGLEGAQEAAAASSEAAKAALNGLSAETSILRELADFSVLRSR